MTLLRDLIDIPERVHKGDFVLKLAEGVRNAQETLGTYVFTPQLLEAFDRALGLVKSALEGNQSKAAFLHGSFGSGKSHFMAVLHLLLANDPLARAHPALGPLVAKHRWLEGRRFLLVPFHMIDAASVEQRVFGQYVSYVRRLHPDSPVPAVFVGEGILRQAELEREKDEASFFAKLGAGGEGWGKLPAWTRERYDRARAASPEDSDRQALISAVVTHFLPGYQDFLSSQSRGFVSLDDGLPILAEHARALGYDALVFFLDEVILWLATMSRDLTFVEREGTKLAKLIESQGAPRPIPIVSLLARQRDLRELVGEHVPGAEKLNIFDAFKWFEGRFDTIKLEDGNLPAIVAQRLLKPRDEGCRKQLDAAFETTRKVRREILDALLAGSYDEKHFRATYPFSPALIQTLVAVSSVLQRERTAIRALVQLLVDQRDTLEVGQLVPVGDLFDVIADGDEPFSPEMQQNFENARKLYHQKLLPRLLRGHGIGVEEYQAGTVEETKRRAFRVDDRIVKTLLLSALAPEVPALRQLTAQRLVALNHGTIKAPIPGQEAGIVLTKLRDWAGEVGEIRLQGDGANPTISIQTTGIDTESILAKARSAVDNVGAQRAKIRELLFAEMGVDPSDGFWTDHVLMWRGTRREIEVWYGNVREMSTDSVRPRATGGWRLVIDYPFDAEGYTPVDDLRQIEKFRGQLTSQTVCWIPAFLSPALRADLGTLVALDHVLSSEQRFHDYSTHLAQIERGQARSVLNSQRDQLRLRLVQALEMAYGISDARPDMLGPGLEVAERFQCLDGHCGQLARPAAANLRQGLEKLAEQMFELQFPAHPKFGVDIKGAVVKRVWEWVQQAARDPMHRVVVEKEKRREVRDVVEPLELGRMNEDALVLGDHWRAHFERRAAQQKGEPITVGRLRAWTDEPEPRGLPEAVQNLLFLAYAEQTNRRFFHHGGGVPAALDKLDDELELREQPLPQEAHWKEARTRASHLCGVNVGEVLGASNVGELCVRVRERLAESLPACRQLMKDLHARLETLGIAAQECARLTAAREAVTVGDALERVEDPLLVERLATATVTTRWEAVGTTLRQAHAVVAALGGTRWEAIDTAIGLSGALTNEAQSLRERLRDAMQRDELTEPLPPTLRALEADANALIKKALRVTPPSAPPAAAPSPPPPKGWRVVDKGARAGLTAAGLRDLVAELERKVEGGRREVRVQWEIVEEERPK